MTHGVTVVFACQLFMQCLCGRNKHQEVCLWTRVEGIFSIRLELPGGVWCYVLSGQSGQSCNIVCTCYVCGRPWDVMIPAQPIVCLCGTELRSFFDPAASEGPNIPRHTGAASLLGTSVLDTPPLSLGPGSDQPPPASPPPSNASASASGWSFAQADSFQEWARDHPQTAAANPWLEAVYQTNNADNAEDEDAIDVTAEVPEDCQAEVDEAREIHRMHDEAFEQWKEDYAREFPHADAEAETEPVTDADPNQWPPPSSPGQSLFFPPVLVPLNPEQIIVSKSQSQ